MGQRESERTESRMMEEELGEETEDEEEEENTGEWLRVETGATE